MALPWRPKMTFGGTDLEFTLPMGPWQYRQNVQGGQDRASSGIREAFVIRRENHLELRLRFRESEWGAVLSWIEWCHDNASSFTLWLDRAVTGTSQACYLESPQAGEDISPARSEYLGVLELTVVVVKTDGSRFSQVQF